MARFAVGDAVEVAMPKGPNKRGVVGISVMFSTWPEARFDGATGTVAQINPRGPLGIPLYLVSFRDHKNRVAIPWQGQWFREEWLTAARPGKPAETRRAEEAAVAGQTGGEFAAATGQGQTTTGESS